MIELIGIHSHQHIHIIALVELRKNSLSFTSLPVKAQPEKGLSCPLLCLYLSKNEKMETVVVALKHAKAKELLYNLERMDVIQVMDSTYSKISKPGKISDLRKLMKEPMDNDLIDEQLGKLRDEWERDF